jgi:hypothetical protein
MEDLRQSILETLARHYEQDPQRYTFVSSLLAEIGVPFDAAIGQMLVELQREGLIDIMQTTNIRVRLTAEGALCLER